MSRPTRIHFDPEALRHNVQRVSFYAPNQKIIAMVKANAYGCGIEKVVPVLQNNVDALGVTCIDEAIVIRNLSPSSRCILFHGLYSADELALIPTLNLECVIHQSIQLKWLLNKPLSQPIKVWVKINTGMNRLGFDLKEAPDVINRLLACPWVSPNIGLITHLASADEPNNPLNQTQLQAFNQLRAAYPTFECSIANSAAILSFPSSHADYVRPGIMLYGISPFSHLDGQAFGLKPVISLTSAIISIHDYPAHTAIGYQGIWQSDKPSRIGLIPVGYGDGYPRHIRAGTPVWLAGREVPIVGRISMDLLTIDLTKCPEVSLGTEVELWGSHLAIERIAEAAGTIAYELPCQITPRVTRGDV